MAIKRTAPVVVATTAPVDKYPVQVIEKEHEGKKFLRITNNENNFKYDGFSGGATKLKQLFSSDKEGDAVLASAAGWLIEQGGMTKEQLVSWYEKFSSQLEELIGDDDFK